MGLAGEWKWAAGVPHKVTPTLSLPPPPPPPRRRTSIQNLIHEILIPNLSATQGAHDAACQAVHMCEKASLKENAMLPFAMTGRGHIQDFAQGPW